MFLEYKIERKNLEALNVNEYQEFPFRIAEISDAQFYVRIYRVTDASHGKICISFGARCEEEIKFSARLRIILQSSKCCMKSSNILPPFCSPGADGRIICCSMADLINLESAPNEQITLKIDGFLIYERKAPKFNAFKLPKQIVPSVFYNKYFHQNIEIFAGGNNTPILMLKRVAAAFAQSLIDAVEDDSTVNIPEFPYEIVETAVKLLNGYSSSCRTFSFENMLVLLHFACSYNIASIKDEVSSFIMKSISPANCAHIFLFSKFIKLENIRAKSVQYLKALAAESKAFSYAEILSDEDKEEIYGASNA
uniref:BTB domain-containing protein n=1 Tax=Panagrolaimus superbus TaxID=310955 RepID=A0A914YJY9_9BILA